MNRKGRKGRNGFEAPAPAIDAHSQIVRHALQTITEPWHMEIDQ